MVGDKINIAPKLITVLNSSIQRLTETAIQDFPRHIHESLVSTNQIIDETKRQNEEFFAQFVIQEVSEVRGKVEILPSSQVRRRELKLKYRLEAYRKSSYWIAAMNKLVELSVAKTWDQAKLEWRLAPRVPLKYNPEGQKCALHDAEIHWVYTLVNLKNRKRIEVGPECVAVHALPTGSEKISEELLAIERAIGDIEKQIAKLEEGIEKAKLEETKQRKLKEKEKLEIKLFRLQIEEVKAARRNLLKDIRARNIKFLRKRGPQIKEMLDALFKYRGIILREDPLGKAREMVPKLIKSTRGAIRTLQAVRQNFVYLHDVDFEKVKGLYEILLKACPVLQVHPRFERKMRGLWNHRKAEVKEIKIFLEEEIAFIEKTHEKWRKDVIEETGAYPLSLFEADQLVTLFGRLKAAGFVLKEEIMKEYPRFGNSLAKLYKNLDKLSPEDQALVKSVIKSWGEDDLIQLKGVKRIVKFKPRAEISAEDEEAIKALVTARIEHEETRRFAKFIGDKWEKDGIFTEEEIGKVRELYRELRKSFIPKADILKEFEGFANKLVELESWKILFSKEERGFIEKKAEEWRDSKVETFSRIDAQKLLGYHETLTANPWTVHAIQQVYPDFAEEVKALRTKRTVSTARGLREIPSLWFIPELLADELKAFAQKLVSRTKTECQHFKVNEVRLVLRIFFELDKLFLRMNALEPDLQGKIKFAADQSWRLSSDEKAKLDLDRFMALRDLGYLDKENIGKIEDLVVSKIDNLANSLGIDERMEELSKLELPPAYRYLLAESKENWRKSGCLFKKGAERLLSKEELAEAIEESEKELKTVREEALKVPFRSRMKLVDRREAARSWGRIGEATTYPEMAKEAIQKLIGALADFWYYKEEKRWIYAIQEEAIFQLREIARTSKQKEALVKAALDNALKSQDKQIKEGAEKASKEIFHS